MKEFLVFSDFELEFLKALGINFADHCFYNIDNNHAYFLTSARYKTLPEVYSATASFMAYEFKGKDGTIVFVRSNDGSNVIPVYVKYKDLIVEFGSAKYPLAKIPDDLSDESKEIINNLRSITVSIMKKKQFSSIYVSPVMDFNKIFRVNIWGRSPSVAGDSANIIGNMSGIEQTIDNKTTNYELSKESFQAVLNNTINEFFKDDERLRNLFLKFIPLFTKVFESSLYMPALCEDYYRDRIQLYRDLVQKNYDERTAEAKFILDNKTEDFNNQEAALNSMIEDYPIHNGIKK